LPDRAALQCVVCGRLASPESSRWRDYHFEDIDGLMEPDEPVYCPECAEREFR
jgi:hypothetical protein